MSVFIEKLRETFEGLDFPTNELKKAVFKYLNLKEEEMATRSTNSGDPKKRKNEEKPKPDGGPTEKDLLKEEIESQASKVRGNLKESIEKLLNL